MRIILLIPFLMATLTVTAQKYVKARIGSNKTTSAIFAPDQSFLAINESNDIQLYTPGTSTISKKIKVSKSDVVSMSYKENGSHILVVSSDRSISMIDPVTGIVFKTYKAKEDVSKAIFVSGNKVAFITEKTLGLYDMDAGQLVYEKAEHTKPIRSLSSSKDGKYVVTGGGDGKVVIYNAMDGAVLMNKKIHNGWVRAVDLSTDGVYLASGDDDGIFILSDSKGTELMKFKDLKGWATSCKFTEDNKYVAVGDEKGNIYIYSVDRKILSQKVTETDFPITSMSFRSDGKELVVVEEMKGARVIDVAALNISSVFTIKDGKDLNPPQILVSNPPNIQNDRYRYSQDYIAIKGIVVDDSGVRSFKINGITVPIKDNGNFVLNLPLSMGDNFVNIEAVDVNDNIAAKKFVITRKNLDGEEYDVAKAKNFLFVVGINDYEHWPKLNNAVKDATDVTSILMGQYNFSFENVIMLKNEQATRANIYKSLRSLIEQISPQDNLVIYYSGHGHYDELLNEGYWVPVDGKLKSSGDYLSNSDLLKIIGTIDSQHTFLVADACFSGSLFSDSKRGYAENVEKFKSRWGLASGRLEVVSDGSLNENSPFTSTVIDFLKTNEKDKFAVSELIQYVKVKVAEKADQTPLGNPLKGAGDEGGEFVFYKKK